ncbi:MAG TPA: hypothetical protein VES20_08165 [Bryobacteraceae bacterium]|nr:hypothetical protein [Bryobacteraceae bacterium]
MDTRQKVVQSLRLPHDARPVRFVLGYFDPVVAEHARVLDAVCRPGEFVVAVVDDPPEPLLDRPARLDMAASLGAVHQVLPVDGTSELPEAQVSDLRPQHLAIRDRLMQRVRQRAGSE